MQDVRTQTLTEKIVSWETSRGQQVNVRVCLQETTYEFLPGDRRRTRDGLDLITEVQLDGKGWMRDDCRPLKDDEKKVAPAGLVGLIGRVGLMQDKWDAIAAARAEVQAHEAWQELEAAKHAGLEAERKYREHTGAVDHAMTLGGRTY